MAEELFNAQSPAPGQAPGIEQAAAMTPTGVMPGEPMFDEETPTEEEAAQYSQMVNQALDFMGRNPEQLIASMNDKSQPAYKNVGNLTFKIAKMVQGQAKAAQVEIGTEVMLGGGAEITEHLMELGNAAEIFPFKQESPEYEQVQAMAYNYAVEVAGKQLLQSPEYTPEVKDQAGSFYAQQVAGEVQRGEVDPNFHQNIANQKVAAGVKQAISGG